MRWRRALSTRDATMHFRWLVPQMCEWWVARSGDVRYYVQETRNAIGVTTGFRWEAVCSVEGDYQGGSIGSEYRTAKLARAAAEEHAKEWSILV